MNDSMRSFGWAAGVMLGAILSASAYADGGWYVAPGYSLTYPDHDLFRGTSSSLGISFGKKILGGPDIELSYDRQELSFDHGLGTLKRDDVSVGTRWAFAQDEAPGLFLTLGAGAVRAAHEHDVYLAPTAYAGIGYAVAIPGISSIDVLNEARVRYTHDSHFPGDKNAIDGQALVKVRYSTPVTAQVATTSTSKPEATPGETAGRPASLRATCKAMSPENTSYATYHCETFEDQDGDGVSDAHDLCRNTIANVVVDGDGCMISVARASTLP